MSVWTDYFNSSSSTSSSGSATIASGATLVPNVSDTIDLCAEPPSNDFVASVPIKTTSIIDCQTALVSVTLADGKWQENYYDYNCVLRQDDITTIALRSHSGGTILRGCNTYDEKLANVPQNLEFEDDLYYIEREANSWQYDGNLYLPRAKFASGYNEADGCIYIFGGVVTLDWLGTDDFFKYDPKTKDFEILDNGGISRRADAYGYCYDGYFYMYGGYTDNLDTENFIKEFWRYHIETGTWSSLAVPTPSITNKIVGGNGKIYIANAMEVGVSGWNPLHETWEYTIDTNSWSMVFDSSIYIPDQYYNFDTFHWHRGTIYYFNEQKLYQILPDEKKVTVGLTLPDLTHNPKMVSYASYIIFAHGFADGGSGGSRDLKWFNTETRLFGKITLVGEAPDAIYGYDIYVIDDSLYMVGGIPLEGFFSWKVWKIYLKDYFQNMPDCGAVPIEPDSFLARLTGGCKITDTHLCPSQFDGYEELPQSLY